MRRKNAPARVFDRVESESLSQTAVAQIEDLILSGVLRAGDMLPGERELAEQLGISRPKVREALKQLAEAELVTIVANEGAHVAQLGGEVMSPALIALYNRSPQAIRDNLEYRREQEAFAARLAAERATDSDRAELRRIVTDMEAADAVPDHRLASELDLAFHHTIAFAAHNRTLTHMMTALYTMNRSTLFFNRSELLNMDRAAESLFRQHADLAEAITRGRPTEAEKVAREHITFIAGLVEAAFKTRQREALAAKRYRRIEE